MPAYLTGTIKDRHPVVHAAVSRTGELVLGVGPIPLVVDTGFTGDIALPGSILRHLKRDFMGYAPYQLADGSHKDMPQWLGATTFGRTVGKETLLFLGKRPARNYTIFIEGDFLIGMEFMMDNCADLAMNFDARSFRLAIR